jgi:Tol biopolymer transport system component
VKRVVRNYFRLFPVLSLPFITPALHYNSLMLPAMSADTKVRGRRYATNSLRVWLCTFSFLLLCASGSLFLHRAAAAASDASPLAVADQVTHDGLTKTGVFSDGSYLYVSESSAGHQVISKIVPGTGERSVIATPFAETRALDVSPDHATLLASPVKAGIRSHELWAIPLRSNEPQRLGEIAADDGAWSPDGEKLVFVKSSDLYVASGAGAQAVKLATVNGRPFSPRFSPDGRRIRFSVGDVESNTSSLWEMANDGSNLHELLPGWNKSQRQCCGIWTADGRYYIFQASQSSPTTVTSLWALDEIQNGNGEKITGPTRITEGPMSFGNPWPSAEKNKIWALGVQPAAEVVTYNSAKDSFDKLLPGISATDVDVSPDGRWVSYVTVPEGVLWRSKRDGSDAKQLTFAPTRAALPRWSPDGERIAYVSVRPGAPWKIMLISADGGEPQLALAEERSQIDANWSADATKLMFGYVLHDTQDLSIRTLDLKTRAVSTIPGSEGLFSPRWSPNGRYIAALSPDSTKVMLFDFHTQKWSAWLTEAAGAVSYPVWSPDSKYLYFDDMVTEEESIRRIKVGQTHAERVFVLHGIERYLGPFGIWSGRAPDGSWMFVSDRSTQEVYSLRIDLSSR